jgi:hypothetical protein
MSWGRSNFLPAGYMPDSKVVQSDHEFMNEINARRPPDAINLAGGGNSSYAAPMISQINDQRTASLKSWTGADNASILDPLFQKYGIAASSDGSGIQLGADAYDSRNGWAGQHNVPIGDDPNNPALGNWQADSGAAISKRQQDQNRQAKAYGQMQGGNYFGGMIDDRYGEAFSGQMQQGNGDPTSGGGTPAAPGQSGFGETFGAKPKQYRAGAWGSYGW